MFDRMKRLLVLLATLFVPLAVPAHAAPAPRLVAQSFDALPHPLPLPYDASADAEGALSKARARARRSGRLLLIDLGGNWCPDCRILAGVLELPEMRRFIRRHFELVMADVGRYDRNMQIPARYGIDRPKGVPTLLVIDPRTDRLLNAGKTTALADARSMTPQALADYIATWTR